MKVLLRPWGNSDAEQLATLANNPKIGGNLTNRFPYPYTLSDANGFIAMTQSSDFVHIFAVEADGQLVGGAGVHPKDDIDCKNLEIGYWIGEPFWGRGIATDAVRLLVEFGWKNYDVTRIYARVFGPNIGSMRVVEKLGFQLEAHLKQTLFKNNAFLDEHIYALRR
ncbi:MAG: hypothetical protein RI894_1267 [Bacteroidota bacterium]|jgi:RimJ/RimL family protein N-acetyltransferase